MATQKLENKKTGIFQIECLNCKHPISFSLNELEKASELIAICTECGKKYAIGDATLKRQLLQFAKLCREIRASEEILSNTAVSVDVGQQNIKIPFKILLTRLKSTLDLVIGDQKVTVVFRVEPTATK